MTTRSFLTAASFAAGFSFAFGTFLSTPAVAGPDPNVIYSSIPNPLPGNIASEGPEAYAFKEIGDGLVFTPGSGGVFHKVRVILSSWGCTSGHWYSSDCTTKPGATFSHPITLNIYSVIDIGGIPTRGTVLATVTKTFDIPYRPSSDPAKCPADYAGFSRWYSDKEKTCYHGLANQVEFDIGNLNLAVPDKVIIGVAFNSSHYGYVPIGESAPCYTSSGGCPYDSLNVSTDGPGGLVGSVIDPNGIFINYTSPSSYCPGHVYQGDNIQLDTGESCWAGYHPQIEMVAKERNKRKPNKNGPAGP